MDHDSGMRGAVMAHLRQTTGYTPFHAAGDAKHHHHHHPHSLPDTHRASARSDMQDGDAEEVELRESWMIGVGDDATMVDVFVLDEDYHMTYQLQFWVTLIELTMAVSFAVVGAFAVSDTFEINSFIFVIVGSVLSVVVVFFVHICAIIKTWARSSNMSHDHIFNVTLPVFSGVVLLALSFFVLGMWVSDNCTCCATAACQPDPLDFDSVAKFHVAWTIMVVSNIVWASVVVRALFAHIYPEVKVPTTADPTKTKMPLAFQQQQQAADARRGKLSSGAHKIAAQPAARDTRY